MSQWKAWQRWFAAAAVVLSGPVLAGEKDDPNGRRRAMDEWYNESYGKQYGKQKKGGPWSAAFRKHMNQAAAKERETYSSLLPGTSSPILPAGDPSASLAATGTTWVNIGPTKANYAQNGGTILNKTDTGRVRDIIIDPTNASTLYIAFSGGGVWKSTDAGATWTPKTETLGSLSTGSLSMDPNNSNTLYLGLGDPFDGTGIGLVKSTDGGNTWFAPVYLGNATEIPDLMVAPGNSNIVLAATNAGLFRSVDAGATWSAIPLNTGFPGPTYGWSIEWAGGTRFVAAIDADPLNANGATQGQVWASNDNGATWTRSTGITSTGGLERITLAAAPSSRTTLYALAANPAGNLADIYKSTNGGTSWTALAAGGKRYKNGNAEGRTVSTLFNGQGWYDHLLIVHPTNPSLVFFGGALHLAKTTDGGASYSQVSNWLGQFALPYVHADFHAAAFDAAGKLYVGSDGGVFVSADGGTTFSDALNLGIASHLVYDLGMSGANRNAVIAGLQDNGTRVRVNDTAIYNQEIGGDGFDSEIHPTNASLMLGSLYYSRIQRSTDGGLNWVAACTGITECNNSGTAPFVTRMALGLADATGNTVYTHTNARVYRSTNFGTSWTALGATGLPTTSLFLRNVGAAKSNASVIGAVANTGRVFLTSNGGTSWTQAGALPNNGYSLSDIVFDPANANVIYVSSVVADAAFNHLWKSTDFGATWTVIENGLPAGVPVNTVTVDPTSSATLYAATHLGVYRSTDAGASWTRFGAGMPLVNVTDVQILPDSSLVRAATFGRAIWELRP
ncbi:WD40/YVTN/BNR-like repeat-containing protein [Pyxidicoccus xibeiensis]|uniref:WD40/YVTN/BNR-like repeat-containing protein n=1 Tax=Pyxidicoccus xibeiensis TaxID=2906759 RepID=UPI0020A7EACD|nr:exo-alpha-sialidase [Pyxidicoccus xibeiensis]MCP3143185.1 hypothetical protein [Pyxidicoccus xibeiensis]